MSNERKKRIPFKWFGLQGYFGALFFLLLLITGLALALVGRHAIEDLVTVALNKRVEAIARQVRTKTVDALRGQAVPVLELLAPVAPGKRTLEERLDLLPMLYAVLRINPILHNIFIGYKNGDFFSVSLLDSEARRRAYSPPPEASLVVTSFVGDIRPVVPVDIFFNAQLKEVTRRSDEAFQDFDPREHAWYRHVMIAFGAIETEPVFMKKFNSMAVIFAQRSEDGDVVFATSVLLSYLCSMLERELPTPDSHLSLFRLDGTPIAGARGMTVEGPEGGRLRTLSDFSKPVLSGREMALAGVRGDGIPFSADGKDWLLFIEDFGLEGAENFMVMAVPRELVIRNAEIFMRYFTLGIVGALLFSLPLVWVAVRRISRSLHMLAKQTRRFGDMQADETCGPTSGLLEIENLSLGVNRLQDSLQKVLAVIGMIGVEKDMSRLIGRILQETVTAARMHGGRVIALDENGRYDKTEYHFWVGGEVRTTPVDLSGEPEKAAALALSWGEAVLDSVWKGTPDADMDSMREGFNASDVVRVHRVWVALRGRTGTPLGVMVFFRRAQDSRFEVSPAWAALLESLGRAVGIVLEMQHLLQGQRNLQSAFLHILAGAIDAKSPYTGGHCARVPLIFQMLLQAACETREGPLADFHLDEDGWEEARLAGWLHDCGKVTTPEYVMDKATKLETLHDRIHEVRTRFEVLKRDAEIVYWRRISAGAERSVAARLLEMELQELDEEFAFVASCNLGVEEMDAEAIERLYAIGSRTWIRTLDKRLGVSRGERARMDRAEAPPPPVVEPLLADNPEQIIPRGPKDRLPADNPWGFRVTAPEALYNRGELHNLSIRHGTLTPEERYKVNDHITQTIMMLSRMPWSKELAAVPEIAGAHHETMDGRGYPRRLVREEMSWKARMMAVADIFEALTAGDRPYKAGKTLSEALNIMDKMCGDGQIDPDIYALFLRAGIPERYAAEYLSRAQNDLAAGAERKTQERPVAWVAV